MAEATPHLIGAASGLRIEIAWSAAGGETVEELTEGKLRLFVGDEAVWFGRHPDEPVTWSWADLLEHLAVFWTRLRLEQTYPIDLDGVRYPSELRSAAERARARLSEKEDDLIYAFEAVHDLARAVPGIELPPLRLMREGKCVWLDWSPDSRPGSAVEFLPAVEIFATLEQFCDAICARIQRLESDRARYLLKIWEDRGRASDDEILEMATGWSKPRIRQIQEYARERNQMLPRRKDPDSRSFACDRAPA